MWISQRTLSTFPAFNFLKNKCLHTGILQSYWHLFVPHYFEIIQHLYDNRIWIFFFTPNSDAGLFLTGCQIPLYLCFSVSESGVIKYANSLPLEECAFIHKRFKHLETKSFVYKVIAWAITLTSCHLPP